MLNCVECLHFDCEQSLLGMSNFYLGNLSSLWPSLVIAVEALLGRHFSLALVAEEILNSESRQVFNPSSGHKPPLFTIGLEFPA